MEGPPPNPDPDAPLVVRVAAGDERAFTELARRHAGRLRALALRFSGHAAEADEIVQDALWTVWRTAGQWRPDGPPFAAWLTRVTINRAIDADRRRKVRRFFGLEAAAETVDSSPSAEDTTAGREELAAVIRDIQSLPARQRAAILLATQGEHGTEEIATTMGISVGAAEQLLVRARRTLRARLSERMETEGR